MLTTLIRRELLDNLMTFRFAAAVLIMLLLGVANTVVLIKDYEQRLADYNTALKTHRQQLQEKITYSSGELKVDRPPNPLSIFNVGFDKRLGNKVTVLILTEPTQRAFISLVFRQVCLRSLSLQKQFRSLKTR